MHGCDPELIFRRILMIARLNLACEKSLTMHVVSTHSLLSPFHCCVVYQDCFGHLPALSSPGIHPQIQGVMHDQIRPLLLTVESYVDWVELCGY